MLRSSLYIIVPAEIAVILLNWAYVLIHSGPANIQHLAEDDFKYNSLNQNICIFKEILLIFYKDSVFRYCIDH